MFEFIRGYTTLHTAVISRDSAPMVKLLLEKRAEPRLKTAGGANALHFAYAQELEARTFGWAACGDSASC